MGVTEAIGGHPIKVVMGDAQVHLTPAMLSQVRVAVGEGGLSSGGLLIPHPQEVSGGLDEVQVVVHNPAAQVSHCSQGRRLEIIQFGIVIYKLTVIWLGNSSIKASRLKLDSQR